MLNNRPYNAKQVTQNVRFQSHSKGMGDIMEYQPNSPVLQIVGGKSFGNSGGLYQGVTRSGQYGGMRGLGDDSSDGSYDPTAFIGPLQPGQSIPTYGSTSGGVGVYSTPFPTSFNEYIQDTLVSAGLDPNTSATIANTVTNPIVWIGGLALIVFSVNTRRR